jgi:membrane fusion protein (multidrug efflux system)
MAEKTKAKRKGFVLRGLLLGATPILVLAAAGYVYETGGQSITTENAYVKAEIITISPSVEGRVTEVRVRDNQEVEAGALLFAIDPRPFEIALAAAQADLQNVAQRIKALRAHYRQGSNELSAVRERIRYLALVSERQEQLRAKGVGTKVKLEEAEHVLAMARRRLKVLEEANSMVLADLGGALDLPLERHALYLRAAASVDQAALDLSYSKVSAPVAGILSNVTLQAGEYVEVGDPLLALVTSGHPWVQANLKEVQLTHVKVGQRARVVVDSYPDMVMSAVVESISPATGAEFALLPPQNATGNWVKVVQRVPVRLSLDDPKQMALLRAGMTATVSIETGHKRDTLALIRGVLAGATAE